MKHHPHRLALALAAACLLAACGSKEDRIESSLRKGDQFVRSGELDKASVELRNVLQMDPKNARAYLLAAKVSEFQGNARQAFGGYQKAVELQPTLLEAHVGLARIHLFGNELDKADSHIKTVLATEPRHIGARTQAAALLHRRGDSERALQEAAALIAEQKEPAPELALIVAGIHAAKNRPGQALAAVEQALKAQPKNTDLLQVAADISARSAAPAESARAADYYKRAIEARPGDAALWRAWTAYHVRRQESDKAEGVLRQAVAAAPSDSQRRIELLRYVAGTRGLQDAETEYQSALKEVPRDASLRAAMARIYTSFNRPVDTQRVLNDIIVTNADPASVHAARAQLAAYRLQAGQLGEARKLVTEVLQHSPRDNAGLTLRGRLHLIDNHPRDAIIDLRSALRDQPASIELVRLLAQAHRQAGEPQLAREVIGDALKQRPDQLELTLMMAGDLAGARDTRAALALLDAAIKRTPTVGRLYETKAGIQMMAKDAAGADKTLAAYRAAAPNDPASHLVHGRHLADQGRVDAALKAYDEAAAAAPNSPIAYAATVALLIRHKRFDEAHARIDRRLAADARNVLHHQLKGDLALAQRDLAGAEKAYRDCIRIAPSASVGYVNLARTLGARGDVDGGLATLTDGQKAAPGEPAIPIEKAQWLARTQRIDEAIALYEDLHKRVPDNDTVVNNLAYLLAEFKGDKASTERALALVGRFNESVNPNHLDSLGWIHYRLGQYERALPVLERAVAGAPDEPLLQLHLGKALVKAGQVARGKELLRKVIDSKANLPRLDEARALVAQS